MSLPTMTSDGTHRTPRPSPGLLVVLGGVPLGAVAALAVFLVLRPPSLPSESPAAVAGGFPTALTSPVAPGPTLSSVASPTPAPTEHIHIVYASEDPKAPVATTAGATTVALPRLSEKITGATSIKYYAIAGTSPIDLINQMDTYGPTYCAHEDALACVRPGWRTFELSPHYDSHGNCTIASVDIKASYLVWLPRWTRPSRVYPDLLTWWRAVLDHIGWHEGRHIEIENDRLPTLRSNLLGAACGKVASIESSWSASLAQAQGAFDTRDHASWTFPPYSGPGGFFGP